MDRMHNEINRVKSEVVGKLDELLAPRLIDEPNLALAQMTQVNGALVAAVKTLAAEARTVRPDADLTNLNDCPLLRDARDAGLSRRACLMLGRLVRSQSEVRNTVDLGEVSWVSLHRLGVGNKILGEINDFAVTRGVRLKGT